MSSKRHRRSRKHSRKVRANRYVLVNRARRGLRRLTRNMSVAGVDVIENILFPALGVTGGMLFAQWVGGSVVPRLLPNQDPRLTATGGALLSAFLAYKAGEAFGLSTETQATIAAGSGVMGLSPWLPQGLKPITTTIDIVQEAVPSPAAPVNSMSGYYKNTMLGNLMVDVSHAGAPYKGMFGLDDVMDRMEGVSTVEPVDPAMQATRVKAFPRVKERMRTPGDRGYAGGTFARTLFSGAV